MPRNSSEYQREYRLKNVEKLRAYERSRSKRRNGKPAPIIVETPKPAVRRCMASFCKLEGLETLVEGMKVYLCETHKKKTL